MTGIFMINFNSNRVQAFKDFNTILIKDGMRFIKHWITTLKDNDCTYKLSKAEIVGQYIYNKLSKSVKSETA